MAEKQRSFSYDTVERFRFLRSSNQHCFIILDTFESSVIMLLCAFVTCLIKCITYYKCLWGFHVFYKIKLENRGCDKAATTNR